MLLRHDQAQFHSLKTTIESLFGLDAWYELKECTDFSVWKKYVIKVLNAILISIEETVKIRDDDWFNEILENIEFGKACVKSAKDIDELLAVFSSTLIRQVFLQIGTMPRANANSKTLKRTNWELSHYRSVQYVQSSAQIESNFWSTQQRAIGFERQMILRGKYRREKSKLTFSKWCEENINESEE